MPDSELQVEVWALSQTGAEYHQEWTLRTGGARLHVLLNEVMADPVGAEPAQEWVELYNDGRSPVDLAELSLNDGGGAVPLPSYELAAGAYVVLVNEAFRSELEPTWSEAVPTVRLPQLGVRGLSNVGEELSLSVRDRAGMPIVVSRFPATPRPRAGVTLARSNLASEVSTDAIGYHLAPGASPGGENRLEAH
jgi:hypothetical protein